MHKKSFAYLGILDFVTPFSQQMVNDSCNLLTKSYILCHVGVIISLLFTSYSVYIFAVCISYHKLHLFL